MGKFRNSMVDILRAPSTLFPPLPTPISLKLVNRHFDNLQIPDGQAEKLQVNFILNNLMAEVALHKKSHNGSAAVGCGNCSVGDPTVVRCVSCCIFLCDFCKQGHQRGNATKDHKLLTFEELRSRGPAALSKPSMCHIHEGEARKLYCETCEQTICRDCTIVDHRLVLDS